MLLTNQREEDSVYERNHKGRKKQKKHKEIQTEQIPDSGLQEILECALFAPNARNPQKWHFTVIQNKDMINKMIDILKENMINSGIEFLAEREKDPAFNPFRNAPTLILITADKTAHFVEIDCAAAPKTSLAAEFLGLGSHIMTSTELLFTSEKGNKLKQELGFQKGMNTFAQ